MTDLVTDLLWPVQLSLLCHPDIARTHAGKILAAFVAANEICTCASRSCRGIDMWAQFARTRNLAGVNIERGLVFDTAVLAAQYAFGGEGIALVDTYLFGDDIRAGRLVKPFEATLDDGYGYYLTTHPEGLGIRPLRCFAPG